MEGLLHLYDCEAGDSGKEYTMRVLHDIVRDKWMKRQIAQKKLDTLNDMRVDGHLIAAAENKVNRLQREMVALRQAARFIAVRREYAK